MQLDRNLECAERLNRLRNLDLLFVQIQSMLILGRCRDFLGRDRSEYFAVLAGLHADDDGASCEILCHRLRIRKLLGCHLILMCLLESELVFVSLCRLYAKFLGQYKVTGIAVAYLDDLALFAE